MDPDDAVYQGEAEAGLRPGAAGDMDRSWPRRVPVLRLEGIAQGGEAVGRFRGRVVFVRGALPGETVAVSLTERRKGYARGVVERLLRPSPDRCVPPCPLFGRCGGCHWQYAAYPAQLAWKRTIIEEQLRHLGRVASPPVAAPLGMEDPWAYRSTAELHVSPAGQAGFYAAHSHEIVPLDSCPLLAPALDALLLPLQDSLAALSPADRPGQVTLRWSWYESRAMVVLRGGTRRGGESLAARLAGRLPEVAWEGGGEVRPLAGRGYLYESLGPAALRVSPTAFFQVNVPQARRLLAVVRELLDPRPGDRLLDAYAGVGALSLPPAGDSGRVTAIEAHPAAVADLRENAHRLAAGRVEPVEGLVERVLPARRERYDLVLLDPPRRGCLPAALRAVVAAGPRRIVYVSCHPGTLARDVRLLREGGYELVRVQPIDLFPQTCHVESVALLIMDSGGSAGAPRAAARPRSSGRGSTPAQRRRGRR